MSLEGQQIGRYHLQRLLGSGGMGEVYLATDTPVNRQVAIKVIRSEVASSSDTDAAREAARLFQREVKAIAGLDHPHILPLFDYGEVSMAGTTLTYMVMPFRQEGSLASWLRQRDNSTSLSLEEIAHLVHQAASALQYAHDRQIIHQDVKPPNFLIRSNPESPSRPDLLLTDFGIAKLTTATLSASLAIRGTPVYMAPEQWDGQPSPATDQYALGIMAYELLTGRTPFQGGLTQIMYQHVNAQPQPPSTVKSRIPADIDTVILTALAKKPEDRFLSISAFARAFQQAARVPTSGPIQPSSAPAIRDRATPVLMPGKPKSEDISATLTISSAEALTGTHRTLTLPNGRRVRISIPAGAHQGQIIQLDGQGKPYSDESQADRLTLTIAIINTEENEPVSHSGSEDMTVRSNPYLKSFSSDGTAISQIPPPPPPQFFPNSGGMAISQPQPRGFGRGRALLLIGLTLLVVIASIGTLLFYLTRANGGGNGNNFVTATAQATTTSTVGQTTSTVSVPTSPTAIAMTDPYTHKGTLAINDPLTDNNKGYNWDQGTNNNNATCQFTGAGLDVTQPKQQFFHGCIAKATNFSNFVYEVQMTMISGDYAGITFCADKPNGTYYFFYIKPDGEYALKTFSHDQPINTLRSSSTSVIHTGLNSSNLIAVVVQNGNISLYVNQGLIDSVSDNTYSHGQIGVFAGNDSHSAEAVFSNAKVWTL